MKKRTRIKKIKLKQTKMKQAGNIHNLDTLEKEIYKLKLKAKNIEEKLDDNLEKFQHNYSSMFMNSFFRKKKQEKTNGNGFFESAFKNDGFNAIINKVTDRVAERAVEGLENLVDKIFHKKSRT